MFVLLCLFLLYPILFLPLLASSGPRLTQTDGPPSFDSMRIKTLMEKSLLKISITSRYCQILLNEHEVDVIQNTSERQGYAGKTTDIKLIIQQLWGIYSMLSACKC